MSAKTENIIKTLQSAMKQSKPKTSAYDTEAVVRRVEGSTAWVHIPGGVDETPVKLTINASAGDTVQVRVSGGRAFLVGNGTAPPTDDSTATAAVSQISAVSKVVEKVKAVAEKASKIAGNTNQYFWHTESGTDTGAHITEITQDEFLADPENGGGNLLARSNGIAVRDGLTELATFGASGATVGKSSETHVNIDSDSMDVVNSGGTVTASFGESSFFVGTNSKTKISYDTTNGLKLGNTVQVLPSGNFDISYSNFQFNIDTINKYMHMESWGNVFNFGNNGFGVVTEGSDIQLEASGSDVYLTASDPNGLYSSAGIAMKYGTSSRNSSITLDADSIIAHGLASSFLMHKNTFTIPANASYVSINGTEPSGYTFIAWIQLCSSGWVGPLYTTRPNSLTGGTVYATSTSSSARKFDAWMLCARS